MIAENNRAPLIVAIVLLVVLLPPFLYVASYLALVVPAGIESAENQKKNNIEFVIETHFRTGGEWPYRFFSPLIEIDQKVRPKAWQWNNKIDNF